jgi:hypothetical protein
MSRTVLERARSFVDGLSPQAVCDDCIAKHLKLSVRQHANHKTRELAGEPAFQRMKGTCSMCFASKLVVRRQ